MLRGTIEGGREMTFDRRAWLVFFTTLILIVGGVYLYVNLYVEPHGEGTVRNDFGPVEPFEPNK